VVGEEVPVDELRRLSSERKGEPRVKFSPWFWVAGVFFVLLLGAIYVLFGALGTLTRSSEVILREQDASRERGYQNRAAICSLQRDLGSTLPPSCLESGPVKYYNPRVASETRAARVSKTSLVVVCDLARQLGVSSSTVDKSCGVG
jgi:hypothetical protein